MSLYCRSRRRSAIPTRRATKAAADAYLTDVAEPAVLLAAVRALLRMRRAEDAAQAAARAWQATFDAISDGVFLLDKSGRLIRCNYGADRGHRPTGGGLLAGRSQRYTRDCTRPRFPLQNVSQRSRGQPPKWSWTVTSSG